MRNIYNRRVMLVVIFVLAIISISWEQGEAKTPPLWALLFSVVCIGAGLVFYCFALKDWFALMSPQLSAPDGNTSATLAEMRNSVTELDTRLTEHFILVRETRPGDRANVIDDVIGQIEEEFPRLSRKYLCIRHYDFRRLLIEMVFSVIVFFASMYMVTLTLESGMNRNDPLRFPGYTESSWGHRGVPEIVLESFYFSTVTFVSLGYGDISPSESWVSRILAIMEALSFLFLLGVGLSFALTTLSLTSALETREAMRQIRQELWAEAGPEERKCSDDK